MTLKKITLTLAAAACILGGCRKEMTVGEAVDFLYEYMSIADKGDYSEDFFRDNAEVALRARREMPWESSWTTGCSGTSCCPSG